MSDFIQGYEASSWWGVGAPRNTPAAIMDRLNPEINAALANPRMKARITDLGAVALPGSTADFAKLIVADAEKWLKVIRTANIKL
jgi:tripartite-type tricarboxylate transporter receptor subunit TctC